MVVHYNTIRSSLQDKFIGCKTMFFSSSVDITNLNKNEANFNVGKHIWPDCNHSNTGKIACTYAVLKKFKKM